mgnify:CR=1 FL=1
MCDQILYEVAEPAAIITLNRPKQLNAWTDRMGAEVKHAHGAGRGRQARRRDHSHRCRARLLRRRRRCSCSGRSARAAAPARDPGRARRREPGDPPWATTSAAPTRTCCRSGSPSSPRVNGPVAGMAVPIVACCDIRFASPEAVVHDRLLEARPDRRVGLELDPAAPRRSGTRSDLLFSARKVDAAEAERIGLVNRVVAGEELLAYARQYVETSPPTARRPR